MTRFTKEGVLKRLKKLCVLFLFAMVMLTLASCGGNENPAGQTEPNHVQDQSHPSNGLSASGGNAQEPTLEDGTSAPTEDTEGADAPVTVEDLIDGKNAAQPEIEVNGVKYRMRESVSAYLLMGIDKSGEAGKQDIADDNGRNDMNLLVVVDHTAKTYTTLQLNRDTMVPVDAITYYGGYMDTFDMPLCLAHFYGDGAEISCGNVLKSVRYLLGEIPINGYIALQYEGIADVNDAVGGVSVTITDDFSRLDSTLEMGQTVLLKGEQAHHYVRGRMNVGDGNNTSRERRQRIYMDAFAAKCRQEIKQNSSIINTIYNAAKPYMVTDMSLGTMSNLAVKCLNYTDHGILTLPENFSIPKDGESWGGYVIGTVDSDKLTSMVISLFYQKAD